MLGFHAFATLPALLLFLPQLYLFLFGIDSGFIIVDRLYPHPQPREPFRRHPGLIYAHIYLSAAALFLALAQTSTTAITVTTSTRTTFNSRQRRHTVLGWLYLACLTLGAAAGVSYAWLQGYGSDGGVGASVAFTGLALAGVVPAWLALWCALVRRDRAAHGLWMSRSVAALWGASVFFRVLANTYLVWVARVSADIYPGWVAMIWMSWVVPVAALELYRTLTSPPTTGVVTKPTKAD
jgi:hypothetical protein